ncbi:MAG: sulfur carrier protein ThiS [Campylobacteraceae bacterium]
MKIKVNGEELKTKAKTIEELIKELGVENQVMAAAKNMEVVKKDEWNKELLSESDEIELLRFVGGGE